MLSSTGLVKEFGRIGAREESGKRGVGRPWRRLGYSHSFGKAAGIGQALRNVKRILPIGTPAERGFGSGWKFLSR